MNFSIIKRIISTVGKCPECCSDINITNDFNGKLGFANKLVIKCELCEWKSTFFTSVIMKKESKSTRGYARYDVDARSVFAFREIGKGYQAIRDFAMHMNMVPPYNAKAYNSINDMIHNAYEEAAESSMKKASDEVRALLNYADDQTADIEVSLDGTWQKRGYASLNGVTTVIAKTNEKCIDKHVMSKFCPSCSHWENKKDDPEYNEWHVKHESQCKINHKKSSGAMEGASAVILFKNSIDRRNLRYTTYVGDGDTSSYKEVCDSKPYGDIIISKKEGRGHVQKRVGTRLRNLRKEMKGKLFTDEKDCKRKGLGGTGRLSDRNINMIQNYYGMAIRQNSDSVYTMKKAIGAILYHCSNSIDGCEASRHRYCPKGSDSWCKWQVDQTTGLQTYKPKINLPTHIRNLLWSSDSYTPSIFRDLSDEKLIEK